MGKGHVMGMGRARVNWTCSSKQNCVSDSGERDINPQEEIECWACMYECTMICGSCAEKQKTDGRQAEFEIQCPWNHKMHRYPPSEDRDGLDWQCDFPPQGACVAGIGEVGQYGSYPELDVWRCIEDTRVKAGGECNLDLCGTCVEAMKQRVRINLKAALQKQLSPKRSDDSSRGKLFFKMQYCNSSNNWVIAVEKCSGLPTTIDGERVRPFIRMFSLPYMSADDSEIAEDISEIAKEVAHLSPGTSGQGGEVKSKRTGALGSFRTTLSAMAKGVKKGAKDDSLTCNKGHTLTKGKASGGDWICDICDCHYSNGDTTWSCSKNFKRKGKKWGDSNTCDFDCCNDCMENYKGGMSSSDSYSESDDDDINNYTFDWEAGWTSSNSSWLKGVIWSETVVFQVWTDTKHGIGEVHVPMWRHTTHLDGDGFSEIATLREITSKTYGEKPLINKNQIQ